MFDTLFSKGCAGNSPQLGRLAALLAPLLLASPAVAQSGTWNKPAGGSWGSAGNWLEGAVPSGAHGTADFSTQDLTTNATVTLDGNRTIGFLMFVTEGTLRLGYNSSGRGGSGGTLRGDLLIQEGATVVATLGNALGYSGTNWVRHVNINGTICNSPEQRSGSNT